MTPTRETATEIAKRIAAYVDSGGSPSVDGLVLLIEPVLQQARLDGANLALAEDVLARFRALEQTK